ncbi:MAG: integrase arm-type DNA-binding domain-containing protein [Pseudomonadota bacterium]
MTKRHALTALTSKKFEAGKYADGQGLWLCKRDISAGKWVLRLTINGRRREMGLGPWPDVSLSEAREHAANARRNVRFGIDPIEERRKLRQWKERLSVADAVKGCFEARQAELKGNGVDGRWMSPLALHVLPKIGKTAIEDLDQHVIKDVMKPIWHKKADTARKAMNRINLTLKHAAALGLEVDMQATMKARALLGKQRYEVKHIPAMPYQEVPDFYRWLCNQPHQSCLALRFLILTATRTSEVRFATYSEIECDTWTIPAKRTKTGNELRVPLSDECLRIIKQSQKIGNSHHLFTSPTGLALSDAAMSKLMIREGYDYRPHGFRASFRTWVEEQTDTPFEVKEMALGHKVDIGIIGAYQRSDRLEKRRKLMNEWKHFVTSKL